MQTLRWLITALLWSMMKSECRKSQELSGGRLEMTAALAYSQALAGHRREAEEILAELKEALSHRYVSPYAIALIHVALGEREKALDWLEKGYQGRAFYMIWLKCDPRLDPLRTEPRFVSLLQKMGFGK